MVKTVYSGFSDILGRFHPNNFPAVGFNYRVSAKSFPFIPLPPSLSHFFPFSFLSLLLTYPKQPTIVGLDEESIVVARH